MTSTYPQRPSHFAHKFCRLMVKVCLANELGSDACWLLSTIAHTEDASHYRRPTTWFNGQLMTVLGINHQKTLIGIRQRCVDAGWLNYIPGGKSRAGQYWVAIPDHARNLDDFPTDEGQDTGTCASENEVNNNQNGTCASKNEPERETIGKSSVSDRIIHSTLTLTLPLNANAEQSENRKQAKWNPRFSEGEFQNLARGLNRFSQAVAAGVVVEEDRLRFLTLWGHVGRRHTEGHVRSPGALLLDRIRSGKWDGTEADEQAATEFLRDQKRNGQHPVAPELAGAVAALQSRVRIPGGDE